MTDKPLIAVYSKQHRAQLRKYPIQLSDGKSCNKVHVYRTAEGREIVCTGVFTNPDNYKFSDKEILGPVVKWIRNEPA